MQPTYRLLIYIVLLISTLGFTTAQAQSERGLERLEVKSQNRPLDSLARVVAERRGRPAEPGPPRQIMNFVGKGKPALPDSLDGPDLALQNAVGVEGSITVGNTSSPMGFDGAANRVDNANVNGYIVAPPDTDGQIGGVNGEYFVQMVNSLTTIFNRDGTRVANSYAQAGDNSSFASNAFWDGMGGDCERYNNGDPIVLYDEVLDRWLVSQFAFPDNMRRFSQCVAISQTADPTGGYNRYDFSFSNIGFNDYPKHGIVTDSITLMANIFQIQGPFGSFAGTFLGVMDKNAMYAGNEATLVGSNIGPNEFGFVAGDLDGPSANGVPALFATAMTSTSNSNFDIWQADIDWSAGNPSSTLDLRRIARIGVTPFDSVLCGASRGACIPQPNGGPAFESLSDRLMHRLQIRDFGSYRTMLATHSVDATGNGIAGIRWYEFRESGGSWSLYQEGTYAPNDGLYRWMPSIAMNDNGDIGVGFLFGNSGTALSIGVTGQTKAEGDQATGIFDAGEAVCIDGSGVQEDTGRSGDYSSTSVDPADGLTFWHTNEYVLSTAQYSWNTYVCPFTVGDGGGGTGNNPPNAVITSAIPDVNNGRRYDFNASGSSDNDGDTLTYAWNFGDGASGSGVTTSHTYDADGTFTVTLTVSDGKGGSDSATVQVNPDDGINEPPSVDSISVECNNSLTCDMVASASDPDGSVVQYDWDFGDGNTADNGGASISHTYTAAGSYTVTVTATDDGGGDGPKSASDTAQANPSDPVEPTTVSVTSVVLDTLNRGGGNKSPRATVTLEDDQGNPVAGATIAGTFSGNFGSASDTTDANGVAVLVSNQTARGKVNFTFCVDSVNAGSALTWDGSNSCP